MINSSRILVVDDESSMREMVSVLLKRHSFEVATANSCQQVVELLDAGDRFDLVITDLLMDHGGGIEVLSEIKDRQLSCEVIVITAFGTAETAVEAMKKGAFDYVTKPFNVDEFMIIVRQALERQALIRENIDLRARVRGEYRFADIVGRSQTMQDVITLCRKVADSTATVLISGDSGTGKEVVARALHFAGPRANKPFIAVNCGALPEQLMESELFGHIKGSFTGATEDKDGLFPAAKGGTVFLDEIGELPLPLQVKMLRVLQDRKVRPVGSSHEMSVDIRVMAATNQNLDEQIKNGNFRTDLYYRLNVIHIKLPPLCRRKEDIPVLVEHLLDRLSFEQDKPPKRLTKDAMRVLLQYDYPGNVRELANILERSATLAISDKIDVRDLPDDLNYSLETNTAQLPVLPEDGIDLDSSLRSFEQSLIDQALERTEGVRTQAAALLGISFRSLRYRLSKLEMATGEDEQN
ncbi:MAG: sigma-54-dependent Fis family transcriptional regulator [Proteobacteria bacterium]|nr:sigma-54-dependent Fis family transcriptional regulator [Pseudomonadota bacterium]